MPTGTPQARHSAVFLREAGPRATMPASDPHPTSSRSARTRPGSWPPSSRRRSTPSPVASRLPRLRPVTPVRTARTGQRHRYPCCQPVSAGLRLRRPRLDVQRHRPQAAARHPRRRRRQRQPHARCRPAHPGRLQRPGRRRQQHPDLQRHPGQRHGRDAQRHRRGHVRRRVPHCVPLWSGWPAAVVVGELPGRPDRGQLGHREARQLQPGLRVLLGAERRHRGRGRLLQRRHACRRCRSHLGHPAAPARHPARHRGGQPHQGSDRRPPTSPSRSPAWARCPLVPPVSC